MVKYLFIRFPNLHNRQSSKSSTFFHIVYHNINIIRNNISFTSSSELPIWLTDGFSVTFWWLVRATYVVDGRFFGHFFWKVVGTVRIHVSHVQLPYMVINVWRINMWVEAAFTCVTRVVLTSGCSLLKGSID